MELPSEPLTYVETNTPTHSVILIAVPKSVLAKFKFVNDVISLYCASKGPLLAESAPPGCTS